MIFPLKFAISKVILKYKEIFKRNKFMVIFKEMFCHVRFAFLIMMIINPFTKSPTCFFNVIFMISRTFKIIHWMMFMSTLVLSLILKLGPSFVPVFINVFSMSSGKWYLSGTLTWPTLRKEILIQKFFMLTPKKQFSKQKNSSCSFKRNNNQTQSIKKN